MKDEYKDHCIIIRDSDGNVIQNPTIEWHYPSGVGAWGREEIVAEPMDPEDIIWLATQRKELLDALDDMLVERTLEGYPPSTHMALAIDRAKAALAKARGEQ